MKDVIVLKKYANRRLYDTQQSVYVTSSDVAGIIRREKRIKAIDAGTKEDVTAFVLTQIILDEAKKNNARAAGAVAAHDHSIRRKCPGRIF